MSPSPASSTSATAPTRRGRRAAAREARTAHRDPNRLGLRALRVGPFSTVLHPGRVVAVVVLALLAFLVFAANIGLGDYPMSIPDVVRTLLGGGTRLEETIVFKWRMGRAVVGLAVGAALAFSGALTQSVARNPLASPDVLGITNGASTAAVFVITAAGGAGVVGAVADFGLHTLTVPVVAIIGSAVTAAVVWFIAGRDRESMMRLVLIGVGTSIFLNAISTWLMAGTTLEQAAAARLWLTGSLNGPGWSEAWVPLICAVAALVLAGWLAFQLSALALGPTVAHMLGHSLRWAQAAQLLVAVVLAAVAVSAAGPIPFVAFVAPQVAQRMTGAAAPPLWCSALTGALLVSAADFAARVLLPWELPVGIVTAMCGAPVLIYLVLKMNRKATA